MEHMVNFVVVLGAGESGVGAALLAKKQGFKVFLSDAGSIQPKYKEVLLCNAIDFEEDQHSWELIKEAVLVVKSPGIPKKSPIVQSFIQQGTELIGEIEFAARFCKGKLIAITGSNGKTTTTALIFHLLNSAGFNVALGGNIGKSFAALIAEDSSYDYYVLELSSFQLEDIKQTAFDIAVLLNISPDHLDRYEYDIEAYVDAKWRITQNATKDSVLIINGKDDYLMKRLRQNDFNGKSYLFGDDVCFDGYWTDKAFVINETFAIARNKSNLLGIHNCYNVVAALKVAECVGIQKEDLEMCLSKFNAIAHRLEYVASIGGVRYVNDSKATNVDAVFYALEAMPKGVVWIVGGVDKGNDYSCLFPLVKEKVKAIVCLGGNNLKLLGFFSGFEVAIAEAKSMQEALTCCKLFASDGDTVLLSPACASFDLFKNYEDRGNQFKLYIKSTNY